MMTTRQDALVWLVKRMRHEDRLASNCTTSYWADELEALLTATPASEPAPTEYEQCHSSNIKFCETCGVCHELPLHATPRTPDA